MKTRIVIYRRHFLSNMIEFRISAEKTFLCEVDALSLDAFAASYHLRRCSDFDWAVGDAGRICALFEMPHNNAAAPSLGCGFDSVSWQTFPVAARTLSEGEDKRILQLAVQYIAAGGVDDSVLASDYDKEFLDTIRAELENRQPSAVETEKDHQT